MAKPSKRTPWVVQIYVSALDQWIDVGAYRYEEEAKASADIAHQRTPEVKWRVARLESA